ncbi:MAG: hypothetical protein HMLKMBBP_03825 [Planctomycetes bacterium]|nr:hypothetical protein [Planctomycetota bacterium]
MRAPSPVFLALVVLPAALAACGGGPADRPNVLLLTLETFRADHFGASIDGVRLTPHMDALAARGVRFDRAYAASSFTLPSLHTLVTGEAPPVHRVRFWTQFGNRYRGKTLAERFAAEGYDAASFTSGYAKLDAWPVLGRGFASRTNEMQVAADTLIAPFSGWLGRKRDGPFFAWIHLFEPHTPYAPAESWLDGLGDAAAYRKAGPASWPVERWLPRAGGPDAGARLADRLYAADVRACDDAVRRVFEELSKRGLDRNTVVLVAADHGESLSRDPEPRWDHGTSVDEHLVRIPMFVLGPGVAASAPRTDIARHLDAAPTLLRLAGLGAGDLPGRDLFGGAPPPLAAVAEATVARKTDAPMYTVTDGTKSLRIATETAPATVTLRSESGSSGASIPVDLSAPPPGAAAFAAYWKSESETWLRRAADLNEPGADDGKLSPEQEAVLKMGGYIR